MEPRSGTALDPALPLLHVRRALGHECTVYRRTTRVYRPTRMTAVVCRPRRPPPSRRARPAAARLAARARGAAAPEYEHAGAGDVRKREPRRRPARACRRQRDDVGVLVHEEAVDGDGRGCHRAGRPARPSCSGPRARAAARRRRVRVDPKPRAAVGVREDRRAPDEAAARGVGHRRSRQRPTRRGRAGRSRAAAGRAAGRRAGPRLPGR